MVVVSALATAAAVAIAVGLRKLRARPMRRDGDGTALEAWTDPAARTKPDDLDVAALGLAPPTAGRLLAVVFTHPACASCDPVAHRVRRLDAVDTEVVDVSATPAAVRAAGITSVPTLVLVGPGGDVVRSWVGSPLAGTVEDTVSRHVG